MANGDDNTTFDPNNWQTPNQTAMQRAYARLLLENSMQNPAVGRSGPFEAVSPWGGAVMAGQGFMGNLLMNRAADAEKQSIQTAEGRLKRQYIPGLGMPAEVAPQGDQSQAQGQSWQSAIPTMVNIESGGDPNAHTGSYTGLLQMGPNERRKYGGNDLAAGTRMLSDEAQQLRTMLHREPTGGEVYLAHQQGVSGFAAHMANPDAPAWQNMASTDEGKQKGAAWAKRAIWGNVPDSMKARFGSVDHITSRDFTNMWLNRVNSGSFDRSSAVPTPGVQLASNAPGLPTGALPEASPLSGPPPSAAQPAGTQMAQAAPAGSPQMAANALRGTVGPAQVPLPGTGAPFPGYFTQRQQVPPGNLTGMLNPYIPESQRDYYLNSYIMQGQPQVFETPTGRWIQPAGGGQPTFQGNIIEKEISGPGGMKVPKFFRGTPNGGYEIITPGQGPAGPAGGGGNPAAPGPQGSIQGQTQTTANAPISGAAPSAASAAPAASTRLAALETGTVSDAPPPGMLTAAPPAGAGKGEVPDIGLPPKTPKGTTPQFAQSMLSQSDRDTFSDMADQAAQADLKTAAATEAGKAATEFSTDLRGKFAFAADENKKIDVLNSVLAKGDVRSGVAAPLILLKRQLVAQFGGDPDNAKDMELASKFFSDLNVDELNKRLKGLGQVRVFEGQLISNANASLSYSPAANRALLSYAQAVNNRIIEATNMLNTELEKNNWVPSPAIQAKVQNYFRDKPIMDDATLKKWNGEIRADKQAGPLGTAPPGQFTPEQAREEIERRSKVKAQ